ncbi:putative reverse transcriptase domain-containing protein [Tanacetum coccineum]
MARQSLKPKRNRDATWFREKVILVEAQGNGKVLTKEELEFLADPGIAEDMSKKAPLGIVENILVKIDKFLFLSDFVILNNTPSETTILGRPFLATIHAKIDVFAGKISL